MEAIALSPATAGKDQSTTCLLECRDMDVMIDLHSMRRTIDPKMPQDNKHLCQRLSNNVTFFIM